MREGRQARSSPRSASPRGPSWRAPTRRRSTPAPDRRRPSRPACSPMPPRGRTLREGTVARRSGRAWRDAWSASRTIACTRRDCRSHRRNRTPCAPPSPRIGSRIRGPGGVPRETQATARDGRRSPSSSPFRRAPCRRSRRPQSPGRRRRSRSRPWQQGPPWRTASTGRRPGLPRRGSERAARSIRRDRRRSRDSRGAPR